MQAVKLIFHTFETHGGGDKLKVWDATGSQLLGKMYDTQTGRPDFIVHNSAAFITFTSNSGNEKKGFEIEYQCYNLTDNGKFFFIFSPF